MIGKRTSALVLTGEQLSAIKNKVDSLRTLTTVKDQIATSERHVRAATRRAAVANATGIFEKEIKHRINLMKHTETVKLLRAKLLRFRKRS